MLGLTVDKLVLIAIVAALLVGPQQLPSCARRLGETIRAARGFLDAARERAVAETGLSAQEWTSLDPRTYDPRRIVREALTSPAPHGGGPATPPGAPTVAPVPAGDTATPTAASPGLEEPGSVEPAACGCTCRRDLVVTPGPVTPETVAPAVGVPAAGTAADVVPTDGTPVDTVEESHESLPARWVVVGGSSGHPRRVLVTDTQR